MEVQDAIVRYNACRFNGTFNVRRRNIIYGKEIHKAFDKLCRKHN